MKSMQQLQKLRRLCIIKHSGDEKYILCHLKSRNQGDDEGQYVLVSYPLPYHSDIAKAYKQTLDDNCEVRVLGGGILTIDREKQKIRTYGISASFGAPDVRLVRECLQATFPDWELDVQVTDYIRG